MELIDTHSHIYLEPFNEDRSLMIAAAIEKGVEAVLEKGYLTADIVGGAGKTVGTRRMGSLILEESLAVLGDARSRH